VHFARDRQSWQAMVIVPNEAPTPVGLIEFIVASAVAEAALAIVTGSRPANRRMTITILSKRRRILVPPHFLSRQ